MAIHFSTLLTAARTVSSLVDYARNGSFSDLLADCGLEAARDALTKADMAQDPTAQIWSAINHLEAAHAALEKSYKGRMNFFSSLATWTDCILQSDKDRLVLCIMAACYKIVGEDALCLRCLDKAEQAHLRDEQEPGLTLLTLGIPQMFNPRVWVLSERWEKLPKVSDQDMAQFREALTRH